MVDSYIPITAGTGTPMRALTGLGPNNAAQQVVSLADQYGVLNPTMPDGSLTVDAGNAALFMDPFDSGLTNWTTGGTVAPTSSGGFASVSPNATTISASSWLRSNPTFTILSQMHLRAGFGVQIETGTITNNTRWWGYGTVAGTPTAALPLTVFAGFMIDYSTGNLQAVTYSAGAKTLVATLTKPSDGFMHKYEVFIRQSRCYWVIDGATVATTTWPVMAQVSGMYLTAGSINHTSAASAIGSLSISYVSMSDTGGNSQAISDGVQGYQKVSVQAKGLQGPYAIASQDLKDSGRIPIVLSATAVTSVTTEALFSMNIWRSGTVTTASQYQVAAGKTFRIQQVQFGVRFITPSTTATFAYARFNMRALTATGTLAVGSPLVYGDTKLGVSNAATPNSDLTVPDGFEFPSGYVIGFSHLDQAATLALDLVVVGFEY